ncbi:MAG: B12-binding domain-containing radical SAM protein [Verrucomicrobia bacterium]|nr:B12-binding domain-containing radical SAM protein [Verrucomicrobiota bacterium]
MQITLICADDDIWASGMRSVSAALKRAGHQTRMIFAGSTKASLDASVMDKVTSLAADSGIIGISSMSRGSTRAKMIIAGLKPLKKPIVWGGMHPTLYPEDCAPHADLVCRGEGEGFMIELAERVAASRPFTDIANGAYSDNGQLRINEPRVLISELDSLPFPDFAQEDEYVVTGNGEVLPNLKMRQSPSILFSGSRGCLYNCHYCSNSQLRAIYRDKGRYARKMTVPKFIAAAKECRKTFPSATYIYFTDEDFFARPIEEIREFAAVYPKEVGMPFECMVSPRQVTDEKMELMVKAGMWRVDVGVESGSDEIKRRIFNRPVDNETVLRAATAISKHPRVVAYYFFIIGNPYEQRADLLGTLGMMKSLPPPSFIRAYSLVFIPGTKLFERACNDGIIKGIEDSGFEMDFLAGLDPSTHSWKQQNLYLNSLLFLMAGKATRSWVGLLPRSLLPLLTKPSLIDFCDRHPAIGNALVSMGQSAVKVRRGALALVSKVLKDNTIAYGLQFVRKKAAKK